MTEANTNVNVNPEGAEGTETKPKKEAPAKVREISLDDAKALSKDVVSTLKDLRKIAKEAGVIGSYKMAKYQLVKELYEIGIDLDVETEDTIDYLEVPEGVSKSAYIRQLAEEGMEIAEITKRLPNTRYQMVYQVLNKVEEADKDAEIERLQNLLAENGIEY